MATKTLKIAELATVRRKKLSDFFGILSKEEGAEMLKDFEKIRKMNIKLMGKRLKMLEINS